MCTKFNFPLAPEMKEAIIQEIEAKIGPDITNLTNSITIENELSHRRRNVEICLQKANNEIPTRLARAEESVKESTDEIDRLKALAETHKQKVENFLLKTAPIQAELEKRFSIIEQLEQALFYMKSYEKIEDLSQKLKQATDDALAVELYGQLKAMCPLHCTGHRAQFVRDTTHYWHNVLLERFAKQYDEVLRSIKWPFTSGQEQGPVSKDTMTKFSLLTRKLFLIEEPSDIKPETYSDSIGIDEKPSVPIRLLIKPLKKRFTYHFTGNRPTARIDRPEWFLTQTLNWIRDHADFIRVNVQPVADGLGMTKTDCENEFNRGIVALAAERIHTILGVYNTQASEADGVDFDAGFAHTVDETLAFHKELNELTDSKINSALSVLTKAENFVRWLAVEKKYALVKLDEILGKEQWMEPVGAGLECAGGATQWVPRGADWFIALLSTIEERYSLLPQPGHRMQFLELQLELVEEWRVRLTQVLSAATAALRTDTFLTADSKPHPLTSVVNAAHHTRAVLLQWAPSLHYLHLRHYREQLERLARLQEQGLDHEPEEDPRKQELHQRGVDRRDYSTPSLMQINEHAHDLAQAQDPMREPDQLFQFEIPYSPQSREVAMPVVKTPRDKRQLELEEAGVFGEAPGLLARLRDAGLTAYVEHAVMEFKATLRDYRRQRWHAMVDMDDAEVTISPSFCLPMAGLSARLIAADSKLAPSLMPKLRTDLSNEIDTYILEELVLENWWSAGGIKQFTHDINRNLIPLFAPPQRAFTSCFPKLVEACLLLNYERDEARGLRAELEAEDAHTKRILQENFIRHLTGREVLMILQQRTDTNDR